jgi:hypothetical protein
LKPQTQGPTCDSWVGATFNKCARLEHV